MVTGINRREQDASRRAGVPESVTQKMVKSERLSVDEEDLLHEKGYVYVPGYSKARGAVQVRAFMRRYVGLTPKRGEALEKARSVWAGLDNPELRVPGYEPMRKRAREIAMPGGKK